MEVDSHHDVAADVGGRMISADSGGNFVDVACIFSKLRDPHLSKLPGRTSPLKATSPM
jgi:hypothetical protein